VEVPDEHVAHLFPLVWGHANFLGTYTFYPGAARGLDNLRPLRSGLAEEDDDEEGSVAWQSSHIPTSLSVEFPGKNVGTPLWQQVHSILRRIFPRITWEDSFLQGQRIVLCSKKASG